MQIDELFCQIQGHQGNKLTHLCIYIDCKYISRWLCRKCTQLNVHHHQDGIYGFSFLRTEIEFKNHYQNNLKTQIIQLLASDVGIQVKSQCLQKIQNDLRTVCTRYEINLFPSDNDITINKLIELYEQEKNRIQVLKNINQIYINYGLRRLTKQQIDHLLSSEKSEFIRDESYLFNKLNQQIKFIYHLFEQWCEYEGLKQIQNIFERLISLKEFINYHEHYIIAHKSVSQVTLSQNEKYMTFREQEDLTQIQIHELYSKKLRTKYYCQNDVQLVSLDSQWKYMVVFDYENFLSYYYINSNKSIKLIKKYELEARISDLQIISLHKVIIINNEYIQVRDFRKNRCLNEIDLSEYNDSDIEIVVFGKKLNIIVLVLSFDDEEHISIFRDDQNQPWIKKDINNEQQITIKQMMIISDDQYLITQDSYEIKLWQIDYQNQSLFINNRISIIQDHQYWFSSFSSSDFNIIKFEYSSVFKLDQNFNESFQMQLATMGPPFRVIISNQYLIVMDIMSLHEIKIFRKARTDYDKLQ